MNNAEPIITAERILAMVRHHLACPPFGYLGSTYGSDVRRLLQQPFTGGLADSFLAKMREDLPILDMAGVTLELGFKDEYPDKRHLILLVSDYEISLGEVAYAGY